MFWISVQTDGLQGYLLIYPFPFLGTEKILLLWLVIYSPFPKKSTESLDYGKFKNYPPSQGYWWSHTKKMSKSMHLLVTSTTVPSL